jgi:hypothetical protein
LGLPDTISSDERRSLRLAGAAAWGAGFCWILWAVLNVATGGGLDLGPPAIGPRTALVGQLLMVGWNLLLLAPALALWRWLRPLSPELMRLYTVCGVASLLFWAYGGASATITPAVETSYLALSGVWWLGTGIVLRTERRALGTFTAVLGLFALWDAVLVGLGPVPFVLVLTSAPKLLLSLVWDFWIGAALWSDRARRG